VLETLYLACCALACCNLWKHFASGWYLCRQFTVTHLPLIALPSDVPAKDLLIGMGQSVVPHGVAQWLQQHSSGGLLTNVVTRLRLLWFLELAEEVVDASQTTQQGFITRCHASSCGLWEQAYRSRTMYLQCAYPNHVVSLLMSTVTLWTVTHKT